MLGSAIVGSGFIAPIHAEALRRLGRSVVGVLGSSPEKSAAAAEAMHAPRAYASLDALLADPEVQTVHLASPNRLHFEQAQRCLAAGKHVVCEKPLGMTPNETAALVDAARRAGTVAAVCFNVRYYPLCQEIRQRIANGDLGRIYHVAGSYVQDWLFRETDFNWRVLSEEGGALRAVADIGSHWLDLTQALVGLPIEDVCADLQTIHPVRRRPLGSVETFQGKLEEASPSASIAVPTEDYGAILFRMKGGVPGSCHVSQVAAGRKNCLRLEIAGSKGSLAWNSERPNELWLGHRDRPNELLLRDPALLDPSVRPFAATPGGHNEGFADTFKQLFRTIYGAIDGGPREDYPTFEDGHRAALLCEAIRRSGKERTWIGVDRT